MICLSSYLHDYNKISGAARPKTANFVMSSNRPDELTDGRTYVHTLDIRSTIEYRTWQYSLPGLSFPASGTNFSIGGTLSLYLSSINFFTSTYRTIATVNVASSSLCKLHMMLVLHYTSSSFMPFYECVRNRPTNGRTKPLIKMQGRI